MRRLIRIGVKDVLITARDRAALGVMLAMPMALILILGLALGGMTGQPDPQPVAIVDLDGGETAEHLVEAFDSEALRKLFTVEKGIGEAEARSAVSKGDLAALLVIPDGVDDALQSGRPLEFEVLVDPGRRTTGEIFRSVVQGLATHGSSAAVVAHTTAGALMEARVPGGEAALRATVDKAVAAATDEGAEPPVRVRAEGAAPAGGFEFEPLDYYGATIATMFLLFGSMIGAFAFLRERKDNTMARLFTTPLRRWELVGGKMLGVFLVAVVQFAMLYAYTRALGADWGDPAGVVLVALAEMLAAVALAAVFAAFGRTEKAVGALGPIVIMLMGAAGGSMMPLQAWPEWLLPLRYFSLIGWANAAMVELQAGGTWVDVLPNAGALTAIAVALAALGTWKLRWER